MQGVFEKIKQFIYKEIDRTSSFVEHDTQYNILHFVEGLEEEYNNGWIPCSERLPEENGLYLVRYENLNCYPSKRLFLNGKFNDTHILAWQPLPELYVEGGGDT